MSENKIVGTLEPTLKEQLKKNSGKAKMFLRVHHLAEGAIQGTEEDRERSFEIYSSPSNLLVDFQDRTVSYKFVDIVQNAVDIIFKAEKAELTKKQ